MKKKVRSILDHSYQFELESYLPLSFRRAIEDRYYRLVNQHLQFNNVQQDPEFIKDPFTHLALYTDHGVMHARHVAEIALKLAYRANGVLIPLKEDLRFTFFKGCVCLIAYLHDMGMAVTSAFGRRTHAEYVIHEIFSGKLNDIIDPLWLNNIGQIAWRIEKMASHMSLNYSPQVVLFEVLALAFCHSKSSISMNQFNSPNKLRQVAQYYQTHSLEEIDCYKKIKKIKQAIRQAKNKRSDIVTLKQELRLEQEKCKTSQHNCCNDFLAQCYQDPTDSYQWLTASDLNCLEFITDVLDSLRIVRSADALRPRGIMLKTSGGDQIFISQKTANVIYALKNKALQTFLLEGGNPLNAAEANLAKASVTTQGDLFFSFHHGLFNTVAATEKAKADIMLLIDDIQADVVNTFRRKPLFMEPRYFKKNKRMWILLEETADDCSFTLALIKDIQKKYPALANKIKIVPSLKSISPNEKKRYLDAKTVAWNRTKKEIVLRSIAKTGHRTDLINTDLAFKHVKVSQLEKGETLFFQQDYAGFVYIPMGLGLEGIPAGKYEIFKVPKWAPIGNTAIIRGDIRNSTVIARRSVKVLIIPKQIYLNYWHATYSGTEFKQAVLQPKKS